MSANEFGAPLLRFTQPRKESLSETFLKQQTPSPAEKALMEWGIRYEKNPDGSLFVPGNLDISKMALTKLPDLSSVCVGGGFFCHYNQFTSLEYVPQGFKKLKSDFGEFASWDAIPEELRVSPETKSRLEQERKAEAEMAVYNAVVLKNNLPVKGPLKLKQR